MTFTGRDLASFLDMLRYDRPTVVDWTHEADRFGVTLESPRPFTVDRWASFGLLVGVIER